MREREADREGVEWSKIETDKERACESMWEREREREKLGDTANSYVGEKLPGRSKCVDEYEVATSTNYVLRAEKLGICWKQCDHESE